MFDLSVFNDAATQLHLLSEARAALLANPGGVEPVLAEIEASLQALAMWIHDVRTQAMAGTAPAEDDVPDLIQI